MSKEKSLTYTVVTDKKLLEVNKKAFDFIMGFENNIETLLRKEKQYKESPSKERPIVQKKTIYNR